MAREAKRNLVLLRIVAGVAAKFPVVHFKIRHRSTRLTPLEVNFSHASITQVISPQEQDGLILNDEARHFAARYR